MGLFDSWTEILRVSLSTVIVYFFVIFLVRVAGKRSASKMNNFDWIVTVAIGSMVSTVILIPQIAVAGGLVAIALLFLLQYGITRFSTRSLWINKLVRAQPRLLYYEGEWLTEALRRERLTRAEVISGARERGFTNMDDILAVVFESSAELSFLRKGEHSTPLLLEDVDGKAA